MNINFELLFLYLKKISNFMFVNIYYKEDIIFVMLINSYNKM